MKILILLILAILLFGCARLFFALLKELKEIASEAWHSGETES